MKHDHISIMVLSLFSICFSKAIILDVENPYASGSIVIKNDELLFSNGIIASFFNFISGDLEHPASFTSLAIDSCVKAGFKYGSSSSWKFLPYTPVNGAGWRDSLEFYSSNDTTWSASISFPDSLLVLDSVVDNSQFPNEPQKTNFGKWLYSERSSIQTPPSNNVTPFEGYNSLMYLISQKSKMKIQVSPLFINTYPNSPPFPNTITRLDSLQIRWAVDSLGNGKFDQTTHIKNKNIRTPMRRDFRLNRIESTINSNSTAVFFSPNGKRFFPPKGIRPGRIPPSVLIYRVAIPGYGECLGKTLRW